MSFTTFLSTFSFIFIQSYICHSSIIAKIKKKQFQKNKTKKIKKVILKSKKQTLISKSRKHFKRLIPPKNKPQIKNKNEASI